MFWAKNSGNTTDIQQIGTSSQFNQQNSNAIANNCNITRKNPPKVIKKIRFVYGSQDSQDDPDNLNSLRFENEKLLAELAERNRSNSTNEIIDEHENENEDDNVNDNDNEKNNQKTKTELLSVVDDDWFNENIDHYNRNARRSVSFTCPTVSSNSATQSAFLVKKKSIENLIANYRFRRRVSLPSQQQSQKSLSIGVASSKSSPSSPTIQLKQLRKMLGAEYFDF